MEQVVYGDILFVINFSMDFLALYLTGAVLHRPRTAPPLAVAAGIGAFYAVLRLFCGGNEIIATLLDVAVSLLMCYIAYGGGRLPGFLLCCALFYVVSFALGGAMTALYAALDRLSGGGGIFPAPSPGIAVTGSPLRRIAAAVAAAAAVWAGFLGTRRRSRRDPVPVELDWQGRRVSFMGLCDSGAQVYDPVGSRPVIIVRPASLAGLLPQPFLDALMGSDPAALSSLSPLWASRVRAIPVTTVGHRGMLFGFLPDRAAVGGEEKAVCVAVDGSGEDLFEGCEAIVPEILCR